MKTRTVLLLALCALLPFLGQAVTNMMWVKCDLDGNKCNGGSGTTIGSETRDMFYRVTLGPTNGIDSFRVGWFNESSGTDFVVVKDSGEVLTTWKSQIILGQTVEPYTNFVAHGATNTTPIGNTDGILVWFAVVTDSAAISNGVYYFGYNTPQTTFETVGFYATNYLAPGGLDEDWSQPVGIGKGPIHVPIPEPTSVLLLGLGGVLIGFFRRFYSKG